jgi:hypothetical protein
VFLGFIPFLCGAVTKRLILSERDGVEVELLLKI